MRRLGAFAVITVLPLVCYLPAFLCNDVSGCPIPSVLHLKDLTIVNLKRETGWPVDGILGLASVRVTALTLGYHLLILLLQAVLPGIESPGLALNSGGKLKYKINGI